MVLPSISSKIRSLPKAELHLHLEGSIQPAIAGVLAQRHNLEVSSQEVADKYSYRDFAGFLEAFKWVTLLLREPRDYAIVVSELGRYLLTQNVTYAEVTLSVGVMLLRGQSVEANFAAISEAAAEFAPRGLQFNWIFDAVRQFGADSGMRVVEAAHRCNSKSIVAFGIGGDERSIPAADFRAAYDRASSIGLHRLIHAGEVGGPENIRDAIESLGVERIGHGIAAIHDPALMDLLAARRIPLEICPQSNLRTGALAHQLRRLQAQIEDHPLPQLLRHGIPVVLSTDDPAMFHTTLLDEYDNARLMGLTENELVSLTQNSFDHAFRRP
jgi:adenosine deaminase